MSGRLCWENIHCYVSVKASNEEGRRVMDFQKGHEVVLVKVFLGW